MSSPSQGGLFGGRSAPRAYAAPHHFSVKPNGYAAQPGTGPAGERCGTCAHCRMRAVHGKRFYKCAAKMDAWSRDRGTDIVLKSPACRYFRRGEPAATSVVPAGECE